MTSYYAPTSRLGNPDEFRHLVDRLHQAGIGVIVDWVPAHFPKDELGAGRFDGTPLYEHRIRAAASTRTGAPTFSTSAAGRSATSSSPTRSTGAGVPIDGLRVDAVASMLYLDYSRRDGGGPNAYGGRENLEAVAFIQEMNATVYKQVPGVVTIAENRPPGRASPDRRTWAASASASSGTWAGCTTRWTTCPASPSTGSTTTTR